MFMLAFLTRVIFTLCKKGRFDTPSPTRDRLVVLPVFGLEIFPSIKTLLKDT
jgi:hypothetical protein